MNKLIAFAITCMITLSGFSQDDPVIMTIDGNPITKSEFLQIYLKNNDNPQYDQASLDEYMELFKRFKLKVAEAEALGYDTIPSLKKELAGYQKTLARPYLIDSTKNEALVREAYERTLEEIHAAHILVRLESNASPEDTLKAYNRLLALKKRIENGESFEAVAKSKMGSEDPTVQKNGGDLGYFTAFQMVYQFEDAAYSTPVGQVSDPFRTRFGYHILKVIDRRPARGTMEAAHLMIAARSDASADEIKNAEAKINELYQMLEDGASFEELVSKYSDDPSSNGKNGVLPQFGTGTTTRMVPEFTEAAFALKEDGEYSKPVQTDYGFHIIKRISWKDVDSFEDLKRGIEKKVAKDARSVKTQASFVNKLKKEYNFKSKSKKGLKWFYQNMDSTYLLGKFKASDYPKNKVMFIMDKQKFRGNEFAKYLENNHRAARKDDIKVMVDKQYKAWEEQAILDYEESKLAGKYPAYKALITEYHDGILLYEVMSDKVWNKAMRDTVGLKAFYENNKSNYQWGPRVDAEVYECNTMLVAQQTKKLLESDTLTSTQIVEAVNESSTLNTKFRKGKFDTTKTGFISAAKSPLKKGINDIYEYDGKYYLVNVLEKLPAGPKEFDEAKGAITSDYQNYLEKEWMKEIEKKHKIVVNEEALYSLGK
ncbi:MAG: peptidylprolyl isomerase [Flavobacteriales bacterium]|nr:peptidylprolyl isomerase [Flavobacteriales bacterium]